MNTMLKRFYRNLVQCVICSAVIVQSRKVVTEQFCLSAFAFTLSMNIFFNLSKPLKDIVLKIHDPFKFSIPHFRFSALTGLLLVPIR